jgi:hypothetical protein
MLILLALLVACALPPEHAITKEQLYQTQIYTYYTIKDSPESVLNAINVDGEVVLEAKFKDNPVYLKILATTDGLQVTVFER